MTAQEAREFVLSKWKDAELVGYPDGDYAIFSREAGHASGTGYIGWGQTKYNVRVADEAWIDAARNLPTPVEPKAQVESASVCEMCGIPTRPIYPMKPDEGVLHIARDGECDYQNCKEVESTSVELKTDVYEVFGSCATSRGWDFLVCTTLSNALDNIADSLDSLEEGEEVKIVFRRYTADQMDEVIYE